MQKGGLAFVYVRGRPRGNMVIPVQWRLEDEMRNCAVELRQLAYTLQNGVGEHDLLRLSERMRAAADGVVPGAS